MSLGMIHDFIKSHGYDFEVEALNGKWQHVKDSNDKKVWYIGSDHGESFITFTFGDFREPDKRFSYCSKAALSAEDEAKLVKFNKKIEKNKSLTQEISKGIVQDLFETWQMSDLGRVNADYLVAKGLPKPPGVLVRTSSEDNQQILVIPMYDAKGELWNIQQIYSGGDKTFHPGAKIKDCFFPFGLIEPSSPVLIGEGFATCLAAHLASDHTTLCAFSISNLENAVKHLLGMGIDSQKIILLADWDGHTFVKTKKNPGMLEVQKLCEKYQVRWTSPVNPKSIELPSINLDFADVFKNEGQTAVKALIETHQMGSELIGLKFEEVSREHESGASELKTPGERKERNIITEPLEPPKELIVCEQPQEPVNAFPIPLDEPRKVKVFTEDMEFPTKAQGFMKAEMKNGKLIEVPDFEGFSKWMAKEYCLKANDAFAYIYKEGYYQRISSLEIRKIAILLVKLNLAPYQIAQFVEHSRIYNFIRQDNLVEPMGLINLANGVLDVRTGRLSEHTPEFFFQYKLPHEYLPEATCPKWLEFLERTFEGNQELVDVCGELFGYILLGGEPFLHKAIVLSGEGRNGKSTFLDVLKYMLGRTNFSNIPISQLDKPFSVVMADGMLANIVGETTAKEINSEAFKTAASGEELIASQKGMPEYPLAFRARIVMACNKLPHLGDATAGAYEKFFILPFNRYIQKKERMPLYAKRVLFPEISGVINWSLRGLERLILRGMLPEISAVNDQNFELREEIDSVFAWMQEAIKLGEGEYVRVKIRDWYPNYENWCQVERRIPVSKIVFGRRLTAEFRKLTHLTLTFPQRNTCVSGRMTLNFKPFTDKGLTY